MFGLPLLGVTASPPPHVPTAPTHWLAQHAAELILAAVFVVPGLFSLRKWLNVDFVAGSAGERLLYTLYATARVWMWFAFAGFFVGYAAVENPISMRWFIMAPIALAAIQLLSGLFLGRSPSSARPTGR